VFTRTNDNAKRASKMLMNVGYQVNILHGRLLKTSKPTAPKGLPAGPVIILIITHNAPGGLDVSSIFRTLNSANPENTGSGAEHIGRSGRLDKNGNAFTLVTNADSMVLHALEKCLVAPLEPLTL
jgi:superfamily II DNA/RNA helicase